MFSPCHPPILPGEPGFPLNAFFKPCKDSGEMKKYITQVQDRLAWGRSREELDRAGRRRKMQEGTKHNRNDQAGAGEGRS